MNDESGAVPKRDKQWRAARWNALAERVRNGDSAATLPAIEAACAEEPDFSPGHYLRAVALLTVGDNLRAADAAADAIACADGSADAHFLRTTALRSAGLVESAIAAARQAVADVPGDARFGPLLAEMLSQQGDVFGAFDAAAAAVEHHPKDFASNFLLAKIAMSLHRWTVAENSFRHMALLSPARPEGHYGLGLCRLADGRFDGAKEAFERTIAADPAVIAGWTSLLYLSNYDPSVSPEARCAQHADWARRFMDGFLPPATAVRRARDADKRLKIGFVSPDFRHHSVVQFVRAIFENRDAANFEIYGYASVAVADDTTQALSRLVDHWRPIDSMDDDAAAALVRADEIDILIDLAGHTAGNRLGVFARKPARVQATWLGYCTTTGIKAVDWFISDTVIVPPGAEGAFVERIWRMPNAYCYAPQDGMPDVAPLPAIRKGHPTFGHFGRNERINDRVLAAWAAILAAVPTGRLLLNSKPFNDRGVRDRLAARFAAVGGDANRLDMVGTSPQPATWAAYGEVDVALDTFPFNAGATTFEALWLGVPVVSMHGPPPLGRMAQSIASSTGLDDWVVGDDSAYIARAVAAVADMGALAALRRSMRARLSASPLMDGAGFAAEFRNALRGMWRAAIAEDETTPSSDNAA